MLVASLLFAFALGAPAPRGDCKDCKPDDLCKPHQEKEAAVIGEWKGKVRAKDIQEAETALGKIADLTKEHANMPSRAVVEALAQALDDPRFTLRADAAERIAKDQHPDATVKALIQGLENVRAEFAKLGRGKERGGNSASILSDDGKRFTEVVVHGLAQQKDDRCVDALAAVLKALPADAPNELVNPIATALQELASRESVRAILARLVAAEGSRNKARSGGGAAGGGGGGSGGGGAGGGKGGGAGGNQRRHGDLDGDGFRDQGAEEGQREALHAALAALARSKNLDDSPPFDTKAAQAWKDWFDKHQAAFPTRLGRVGSELEAGRAASG